MLNSKNANIKLIVFMTLFEDAGANMNGRYLVASGGNQGVPFNDDYKSKGHEYFDVYSPEIATHYGEVFWTDQGNNPIPQEIINRFKGIMHVGLRRFKYYRIKDSIFYILCVMVCLHITRYVY